MFFPLDPEEVISRLSLKPDMVAADFGSGSGLFSVPLAKKLDQGLVYALDVQKPPLSALQNRINAENIPNISLVRADLEKSSKLQDSFLDLALLINVLFQAEDKRAIIQEAQRTVKEKGKVLVIESLDYLKPREIKKMAQETGLVIRKEFNPCQGYWGGIFEKTL